MNEYRWTELLKLQQAMRYGPKEFKADWDTVIACAQMIGMRDQPQPHLETIVDSCFLRIEAYLGNHPENRPWENV